MKIVDEKGRFFGKVNLLDLIVLIFILVAVYIIGSKVLKNPESYNITTSSNVQDMYVTVKVQNINDEFIESLNIGDKLLAQNAYTGGSIYKVHEPEPAIYSGYNSDGEVTLSKHPFNKDVLVTLVAKQDIESPVLKINGQEARIGTRIFFKTQTNESSVQIMDITFDETKVQ